MAGSSLTGGERAIVGDRTGVTGAPEPGVVETAPRRSSVTAARFGMGFAVGVVAGGVAGVLTGLYGPALLVGFSLGLLLGVAASETA